MPHPTPYSRQFDVIRSTYPALFENPRDESRPHTRTASDASTDRRSDCADLPDGK